MKIAICFSGFIRDYNLTFPKLKKYLLDNTDHSFDIYIASWLDNEYDKYKFKININEIIDTYKPKKYSFTNSMIFDSTKYKKYTCNPHTTLSNYYKIQESFKLIDNIHIYDLIIRTRTDINITEQLAKTILNVNKDKLSIFSRPDDINLNQYSDILFVGSPKVLKFIGIIFDELGNIYDNIDILCPHLSLKWYIDNKYLTITDHYVIDNDILVKR